MDTVSVWDYILSNRPLYVNALYAPKMQVCSANNRLAIDPKNILLALILVYIACPADTLAGVLANISQHAAFATVDRLLCALDARVSAQGLHPLC